MTLCPTGFYADDSKWPWDGDWGPLSWEKFLGPVLLVCSVVLDEGFSQGEERGVWQSQSPQALSVNSQHAHPTGQEHSDPECRESLAFASPCPLWRAGSD